MSKEKSQKLSNKDIKAALWVAEQGPVRQDGLKRYLELCNFKLDSRAMRRLTSKLVVNGLIKKEQIFTGSAILWPTTQGLKFAGLEKSRGEGNQRPSLATITHSSQVAEVRNIYESNKAEWICERRLRKQFTDHLPDGLAIYEDSKIIVEIDRTRKDKNRLREIMISNVKYFSGSYVVDYWTVPELYEFICSNLDFLPEQIAKNIRIFIIPKELL